MIKYKYAYNESHGIVSINDISKTNKGSYKCISCGNTLLPRFGRKRAHHFYHKVFVKCSNESYLHQLAKQTFYDLYRDSLTSNIPFIMEYQSIKTCDYCSKYGLDSCSDSEIIQYNLCSKFTNIEMETHDDNYIPDILLTDNEYNKIYIEFAVSNKSDDKKIKSGIRIIEFLINSEDDLELIRNRYIPYPTLEFTKNRKSIVTMHNFKYRKIVGSNPHHNCKKEFNVLYVLYDGRAIFKSETISEYESNNDKVAYKNIIEDDNYKYSPNTTFMRELINAHNKGFKVINCLICRNRNFNIFKIDITMFCNKFEQKFNPDDALNCPNYEVLSKANTGA